jgi:hypothetical protein
MHAIYLSVRKPWQLQDIKEFSLLWTGEGTTLFSCLNIVTSSSFTKPIYFFRLFAHADDPDIDEPLKPDTGNTLGADDKTPGINS